MADRIAVFENGRLLQVGAPLDIYRNPVNRFVAGFVGSPPMNLIQGEVADGMFVAGELKVPLAAAPGPVTLGVRPQHLHVRAEGALPCTIFALERLGRETVLIVEDAARNRLRLLVDPEFQGRVGDPLQIAPDPARCLLFDGAKGLIHAPRN